MCVIWTQLDKRIELYRAFNTILGQHAQYFIIQQRFDDNDDDGELRSFCKCNQYMCKYSWYERVLTIAFTWAFAPKQTHTSKSVLVETARITTSKRIKMNWKSANNNNNNKCKWNSLKTSQLLGEKQAEKALSGRNTKFIQFKLSCFYAHDMAHERENKIFCEMHNTKTDTAYNIQTTTST